MALSRGFVKEEVDYDEDDIYEEVLEEQEDKSTQQSKERGGYCHNAGCGWKMIQPEAWNDTGGIPRDAGGGRSGRREDVRKSK